MMMPMMTPAEEKHEGTRRSWCGNGAKKERGVRWVFVIHQRGLVPTKRAVQH